MVFPFKKQDGRFVINEKTFAKKLDFYKFYPEGQFYNLICTVDKKRYYFKGNGHHTFDVPELFCAAIANKVGIETLQPQPAVFIDKKGVKYTGIVSPDFIEDRTNTEVFNSLGILKYYLMNTNNDYYEMDCEEVMYELRRLNTIENHLQAINFFVQNTNLRLTDRKIEISPTLKQTLKKQQLFYFLMSNEDCYARNIEYQIKQVDNRYVFDVCPVFDNSYSLTLKSFRNKIYDDYENLSRAAFKKQLENGLDQVNIPFGVFEKPTYKPVRSSTALDIATVLLKDPVLMDFYRRFKSVNFKNLFTEFTKSNQYDFIQEKDIDIAAMTLEQTITQLNQAIDCQKVVSSLASFRNKMQGKSELDLLF